MKKVLIICDTFPPQFAPRMGYLCKFLEEYGWEAYVVTGERQSSRADFSALVGYAKQVVSVPQKRHRAWNPLHLWTMISPYDYLRGEYDLRKAAMALCESVKPDVILACPSGLFPLCSAYYVAKKFRLPFCVDYRDLVEEQRSARKKFSFSIPAIKVKLGDLIQWQTIPIRNRILRRASAVSSVSPWYCEYLSRFNNNVCLVYNGYDSDRFKALPPMKSEKFLIVYVGTLSSVVDRDPTILFQAIRALKSKKEISPDFFRVRFYSGEENYKNHLSLAEKFDVCDCVEFLDYIPSTQVPDVMRAASILLVLSRHQSLQTHGVMTTKLFEYLAVNRPILCVPGDRDCKDELLEKSCAGIGVKNVEEAVEFLSMKLREWRETGIVAGTTRMEHVMMYSRRVQAGNFTKMFDSVINK